MIAIAAALIGIAAWLWVPAQARSPQDRLDGRVERPGLATWTRQRLGLDRRAESSRRRRAELQALTGLHAELRAGAVPVHALVSVGHAAWPAAAHAAGAGGDVPAAFHRDVELSRSALGLAAIWRASANSGAGLATGVEQLMALTRAEMRVVDQVRMQLAAPRASGRLLAALPLIGIAMAQLAGADAIGWLLGSPIGLICLVAGGGLDIAGVLWMNSLARTAEASL